MAQAFQVNPGRMYQRQQPERNRRYLAWIRTFPCIVCGTYRWIEAAHFGPHGVSQKASDTQALPVCRKHHRIDARSYHALGPVRFALVHNLDIGGLINMFAHLWQQKEHRQ